MNKTGHTSVHNYFHRQAAEYAILSERGAWAQVRQLEFAQVQRLLALQPHHHLLEVGSGTGYYAQRLRHSVEKYAAIDECDAMVKSSRAVGIIAECVALERFSLEEKFDRILAAGVLEFTEEPRAFLEEITARLAPGGAVVLLTPRPSFRGLAYAIWHRLRGCPCHAFSERKFEELFSGAGLLVKETVEASPISRCWILAGV